MRSAWSDTKPRVHSAHHGPSVACARHMEWLYNRVALQRISRVALRKRWSDTKPRVHSAHHGPSVACGVQGSGFRVQGSGFRVFPVPTETFEPFLRSLKLLKGLSGADE